MTKQRYIASFFIFSILWATALGLPIDNRTKTYIKSYNQTQEGVSIQLSVGQLLISPITAKSFRLAFSKDSIIAKPSDAVIHNSVYSSYILSEHNDKITLTFGYNVLELTKKPFSISYKTPKNTISIDGNLVSENKTGISIELTPQEKITGGGARAIPMNRRGYNLRLNNEPHWGYSWGAENLNYSVPVFTSNRNYMVFFDSPQPSTADIGHTKKNIFRLESEMPHFNFYFIVAEDYKSTLKEYTKITGTQPLPPLWALGNLQSRFGYRSQEQTINVADSMLLAGYALDAIILDLYWFGKGFDGFRMGNLYWEPENWPQPEKMINYLGHKGVKTILITEPFFLTTSSNYQEAADNGYFGKDSVGNSFVIEDFFFGPASLIDVFNKDAMDWFRSKHIPHIESGIAGWWGDLGEPERHPAGIYYKGGKSTEIHNIYGHYWSKMLFDTYKKQYPEQRLFFLNRAGFAGSQRYSVFPWSGDVSRCWSGFKAQLPIMLGMSMSGIPYMHSDLGGFAAGNKDDELFTRWLQFGVFNPIYRPHGESHPSEPIYYNEESQKTIKSFIKLRYELLPYLYTMSMQQSVEGTPLARPLFYEHPDVPEYFDIYDTYYWGDNMLVAPVLEPSISSREVTLPNGDWFYFFNNSYYKGGSVIEIATPYHEIPVFVKAGSFIPMANAVSSTDFYSTDTLNIQYYHHKNINSSKGQVYLDDGKTPLTIENKEYELINFESEYIKKSLKITINSNYKTKSYNNYILLTINNITKKPKKITVNGKHQKINFNNTTNQLIVELPNKQVYTNIIIK